jgi:hypothetical protein
MSVEDPSKEKPYDPMELFRGMRDAYLGAMARTMSEAVKTDAYAQTSGAVLDHYLTLSGPVKEAVDKSMIRALEQLSLPSRMDVLSLSERFTNIEMRLDDMDAKLDGLVSLLKSTPMPAAPMKKAAGRPVTKPVSKKDKK